MASRKPSGAVELDATKHQAGDECLTHANSLIDAIHAKDAEGVIAAIKALTESAEPKGE